MTKEIPCEGTSLEQSNIDIMTKADVIDRMTRLRYRSDIARWLFCHNRVVLFLFTASLIAGMGLFSLIAIDWLLTLNISLLNEVHFRWLIFGLMAVSLLVSFMMFRVNYLRKVWDQGWWTVDDHKAIEYVVVAIKKEMKEVGLDHDEDFRLACPYLISQFGHKSYWVMIQITSDSQLWYRHCVINDFSKG